MKYYYTVESELYSLSNKLHNEWIKRFSDNHLRTEEDYKRHEESIEFIQNNGILLGNITTLNN